MEATQGRQNKYASAPKTLRKAMYQDDSDGHLCAVIDLQRFARGYLVRKHGPEVYVGWRDEILMKRPEDPSETRHNVSRHTEKTLESEDPFPIPLRVTTSTREKGVPLTNRQAAVKIQRFWRKHIDIQVYKYYRDLINFKSQGDPALMLRCVNPKESALFDAAIGIHVKFRLAGERFPPNIYYKVFTHRPIQDLCANAPRDYTQTQAHDMRVKHNKNFSPPQLDNKENWYQRIENNGWRLVSDRLISHMLNDPVTWSTNNKKYEFNHSKLQRRQDVEKAKKKKKIDWMKKMYKEGLMKARTDDPETIALVEGATQGMVATIEAEGPEAVAEWEVDELLDWTTSLNFDDYVTSWRQVGTSAVSEECMEKRLKLRADSADGYRINISKFEGNDRPNEGRREPFSGAN